MSGNADPVSDIDIAIDVLETSHVSRFIDFVDWVEDLPTLYRFDIVNMLEISESFREKIILKGRLI